MIRTQEDTFNKAIELYDMGLNVIPIPYGKKAPTLVKWKEFQSSRIPKDQLVNIINDKICNLGIIVGRQSNLAAVDLDSDEALNWAKDNLTDTPIKVNTHRGQHWLYRLSQDYPTKIKLNINGKPLDLDIKANGGYIVAPGSLHPNGSFYTECEPWSKEKFMNLPDLPIESFPIYKKSKSSNSYSQPKVENSSEEIEAIILSQPRAHEGNGGDNETYKVACMLTKQFGLSIDQAMPIFKKWNQDCSPPWSDEELVEKLKNGQSYGKENYLIESMDNEKKKGSSEFATVLAVLRDVYKCKYDGQKNCFIEGNILKQKKNLYLYDGKRWKLADFEDIDEIKRIIARQKKNKLNNSAVERIFSMLQTFTPTPPKGVAMEGQNSFTINFLNGVAKLKTSKESKETQAILSEHSRSDYLTSLIPFDFPTNRSEKNEPFLEMLDKAFSGDPDKEEKIKCVQQMYGACLFPIYPHLFFLIGTAGSGKSSVLLPLTRLLESKNWCSVEPHEFNGFQMETMLGKMANIVTDINCNREMADGNLKKIEDKVPVRIDRKFLPAIYAPLPSIHIFAGNHFPKMADGMSGAHERRWSVLSFNNNFTKNSRDYDKSFVDKVFTDSPAGIINFALDGALSLQRNAGHYVNPESGIKELARWQATHDWVSLFVQDVVSGLVSGFSATNDHYPLGLSKDFEIKRTNLFEIFIAWSEDFGCRSTPMTRNKFYDQLIRKGFNSVHKSEGDFFQGIGYKIKSYSNLLNKFDTMDNKERSQKGYV